ncbi:MAG: zinc-binding dehydrogenase, partial [Leptospiraceae bacterium]|nr:zinc-binding dehydrogenase [Leptospiraceae bacterium]
GSFISASSGKGNWIKPILSMLKLQIFSLIGEQKFIPLISNFNKLDFLEIKELIAKGNVFPVINKKYSLSQTSEALKVQGEGRVFGKNLIVMDE